MKLLPEWKNSSTWCYVRHSVALQIREAPVCWNPLDSPWCANVPGLWSATPTEIIHKNRSTVGINTPSWEEPCIIVALFVWFPKISSKECCICLLSVITKWFLLRTTTKPCEGLLITHSLYLVSVNSLFVFSLFLFNGCSLKMLMYTKAYVSVFLFCFKNKAPFLISKLLPVYAVIRQRRNIQ